MLKIFKIFENLNVEESTVFWYVTPYSMVEVHRRFGGMYCLCLQGRRVGKAGHQEDWKVKSIPTRLVKPPALSMTCSVLILVNCTLCQLKAGEEEDLNVCVTDQWLENWILPCELARFVTSFVWNGAIYFLLHCHFSSYVFIFLSPRKVKKVKLSLCLTH
jgi:hypothetical protein